MRAIPCRTRGSIFTWLAQVILFVWYLQYWNMWKWKGSDLIYLQYFRWSWNKHSSISHQDAMGKSSKHRINQSRSQSDQSAHGGCVMLWLCCAQSLHILCDKKGWAVSLKMSLVTHTHTHIRLKKGSPYIDLNLFLVKKKQNVWMSRDCFSWTILFGDLQRLDEALWPCRICLPPASTRMCNWSRHIFPNLRSPVECWNVVTRLIVTSHVHPATGAIPGCGSSCKRIYDTIIH